MKPAKFILTAMMAAMIASPVLADNDDDDNGFGMAGLLSKKNRGEIPELTLSAGAPLADVKTIELKSGTYYELEIEADGSQELALFGSDFFRAIWIDEIVINGIEIRPMGINSMEFDKAGSAEISFIAIKPGSYKLGVPGRESQTVEIQIK